MCALVWGKSVWVGGERICLSKCESYVDVKSGHVNEDCWINIPQKNDVFISMTVFGWMLKRGQSQTMCNHEIKKVFVVNGLCIYWANV